jgi:hypothetical protein
MEEQISYKLGEIIEKHISQIEDEIRQTLKDDFENSQLHEDWRNYLSSIRNRSDMYVKLNGDEEKELQYSLAVEFLVHEDRQIDQAIENAIFNHDDISHTIDQYMAGN